MLRMVESERFEMRISPELLAEIDAWAKAQPDNPPRATAVKRPIAMALEEKEGQARGEEMMNQPVTAERPRELLHYDPSCFRLERSRRVVLT